MPIGIGLRSSAGGIQAPDLFWREIRPDGVEVLAQLRFVSRAYDDARDGGPLEKPIQSNLRHGFARGTRHFVHKFIKRVASSTPVVPQARNKSPVPPNVPVPKLNAGTFNPE